MLTWTAPLENSWSPLPLGGEVAVSAAGEGALATGPVRSVEFF